MYQNVQECSRMHAECSIQECIQSAFRMFQNVPECMQTVPEYLQNVSECMQNVPECMQNVPEYMQIHELACSSFLCLSSSQEFRSACYILSKLQENDKICDCYADNASQSFSGDVKISISSQWPYFLQFPHCSLDKFFPF